MPPPRTDTASTRSRARVLVPGQRVRPGDAAAPKAPPAEHFWRTLLPVLALLTAVTRLPSFARPVWNPDEGFLATQARQLAAGGTLYETVVDRKPPLVPWLYRGAFALFGDGSLWPLRVAAALAALAGAVLLASLARRRWGVRAGRTAGVLHLLLSVGLVPEDTQAATFEVFMVPCTVLAMWCADRGRWACAGLGVASAVLAKQTGGAVLVPVLWLLWQSRAGAWAALRVLACAALPVLCAAAAFGPSRFAYWMATGSGSYLSADGAAAHALLRASGNGGLLLLACLPLIPAVVRALRGRPLPQSADVWVWLAASGAAVAVGLQFYGHYFLQLVPALALSGAAALHRTEGGRPHARRAAVAVALTAALASGFLAWAWLAPRAELGHQQRLAAEVRARTSPDDRVLLWGMHPEGYWFADRPPASRYLTAGFLTNYSGGRDGARAGERYAMEGAWPYFRRELRRRPPALVVDDSRGKSYRMSRVPTLRSCLRRHFVRAGTVDGAVLYVRTPEGR